MIDKSRVKLIHTHMHNDVEGNELADKATKAGALDLLLLPPFTPL
jgi:hypothetical protein